MICQKRDFPLWTHQCVDKKAWGPFGHYVKKKITKKWVFQLLCLPYHFCTSLPRSHTVYHVNLQAESEFRNQKVTFTITLNSPTKLISWTHTNHDHMWASIYLFSFLGEQEIQQFNHILEWKKHKLMVSTNPV